MLCNMFFGFLKIYLIINGIVQVSGIFEKEKVDFMKQLVETIHEYSKKIQPTSSNICKNSRNPSDYQGGLISQDDFDCFEKELFLILKQMYDKYVSKLSPEVSDIQAQTNKSADKIEITLFSEPESTICSLLTQCANFIYMCASKSSLIFAIGKCHRLLCQTFPALVAHNCTQDENNYTTYSCDFQNINILRKKLLVNILKIGYPEEYVNQDFNSKDFIQKVHTCIMKIDKIKMLRIRKPPNNDCIFNNLQCDCQNISIDLSVLRKRFKTQTILEEDLSNINNTFLTSETIAKCEPSNKLSNMLHTTMPINWIVRGLIKYAFKNLEDYFLFNMFQYIVNLKLNDDTFIDYFSIKRLVTNMFDKICNYIPLFLYYTIDGHMNVDEVLFDYYFTFCGDIVNFVCSQCPGVKSGTNGTVWHSINCIVESIKDKLLWNSYRTDNFLNVNDSINDECVDLYLQYIRDCYNFLVKYSDGLPFDVSTTFDWLSGKYFLSKDHYNNAEMDKLKETEIVVNNITVTLSEAYYLILPLNSNWNTVLTFHNIISFYLERQFNIYLYRHAMTIILFLNHNRYVKKITINRLRISVNWYGAVQKPFYQYLSKLIKHEPGINIKTLIRKIQLINAGESDRIKNLIPDDTYHEVNSWAVNLLSKKHDAYSLNQLIMANCLEAIDFVNSFMSIVDESLSSNRIIDTHNNTNKNININIEDVTQIYCKNNLAKIFVKASILHRMPILTKIIHRD